MASNMSVVIIDAEKSSITNLENLIKAFDRSIALAGSSQNFEDGYQLVTKTRPAVLIVDIDGDQKVAFDFIKNVQLHHPGTAIFATSSDTSSTNILNAMRNGCSEFLMRPVEQNDLFNALKKIGRFFVQQPARRGSVHGRVVSVYSPKGGVGTTTVATNLAVALHQASGKGVVLVDLDLEAGDTDMFLNIKTKYSLSDVTNNIARLDKAFLEGVLAKHSSGIYLLSEPANVEDAEGITSSQVREVLDHLKTMFQYIVIDTRMGYGDINLAAFDSSDIIMLVGILSLPTIRNMQKALDVFDRLGFGREKVKLIVNRYLRKSEISIEDAQKTLNYDVAWHLPNAYNDVMASINRGLPLTLLAPHSEISRSLKDMAKEVQGILDEMSVKGSHAGMSTH